MTQPNIFVMVDMEGISGICQRSQVLSEGANYNLARRYMTADTNACVEGLFRGGAGWVVVRDAHGSGFNMIYDEFDPRAEYIQGTMEKGRMPRISEFDALVLLGYHGMAGTPQAVLEHTMSSLGWQNFWMNGQRCGEIAIDAGIAGDHGVPTIMVSGDDKCCAEAREFLKDVVTVQVKEGLAREGAWMLSKARAHELITEGAAEAVRRCSEFRPYQVSKPVTMRLELVSMGKVPYKSKHATPIDGRTFEVTGATVEEALNML